MDYAVEIDLLSQKFLSDYPEAQYPELMHKLGRPYACLLIDSHDGYFICVPYRSAIAHQNCYCFSDTERSRTSRSGLDYSKIVIITEPAYLDEQPAIIDQDEYNETMKNMPTIIHEVLEYVDTYIHHVDGTQPLHSRRYARLYRFSTLPYFHDVLGLPSR